MSVLKYAIVRFRPFADAGEFANIGIIVVRIADGGMRFRLAPRRFPRVKSFFDDVAYKAYEDAVKWLELELSRLTYAVPMLGGSGGETTFDRLVGVKESSIIYSENRFLESGDDLDEVAERLFSRYVRRERSSQTSEDIFVKSIRITLKQAGVKGFHSRRIEDDLVPVNFPIAFDRNVFKAIKPLAFSQKSPLAVVDQGAHWRTRLNTLIAKGKLAEGSVLIAIEPPKGEEQGVLIDAYHVALEEVRKLPFDVVVSNGNELASIRIVEFARRASGNGPLFH